MNIFPTMYFSLAMVDLAVVCAASTPSFLQVQPQMDKSGAASDEGAVPVHLLDLPAEEMDKNLRPTRKDLQAKGIFFWNLCNAKVHSNLGGLGPDSGPHELRFTEIGSIHNRTADLLIINTSEYRAWDTKRNTARGCFAVINVRHNHSVSLHYSFVEAGTSKPINWGNTRYSFSFFDNDCSATGCEGVEMITQEDELEDVCLDNNNELEMAVTNKNGFIDEDFQATHEGEGSDNPPPLGSVQKDRAATFDLVGRTSWDMVLKVSRSRQGRNFLFAGATKLCKEKKIKPPSPTPPPTCDAGDCSVWGDPHIISFDVSAKRKRQHPLREAFFRTRGWKSDQLSVYEQGTFWLVNSQRVHIQARYWHNKTNPNVTSLGALAIGGPFLGGNRLIIRSLSGASTWNGKEILPFQYSNFENEYIRASSHHKVELVQNGKPGLGIEIELPDGVSLIVNRWKQSLAVKITMCAQNGGQEGQCGNFNGNHKDDVSEAKEKDSYRVSKSDWLF